jgi:hypothetical protein
MLTNDERLNLKKMITDSECGDNTMNIRRIKHSMLMRDDVRKLDTLKNTHTDLKKSHFDDFVILCKNECNFLYANYTDIFNKLVNDELDLTIMTKLLTILKLIEDSKVDQHEGSVMVGKILKELYVDSATKHLAKIDTLHADKVIEPSVGKPISWSDYKKMN